MSNGPERRSTAGRLRIQKFESDLNPADFFDKLAILKIKLDLEEMRMHIVNDYYDKEPYIGYEHVAKFIVNNTTERGEPFDLCITDPNYLEVKFDPISVEEKGILFGHVFATEDRPGQAQDQYLRLLRHGPAGDESVRSLEDEEFTSYATLSENSLGVIELQVGAVSNILVANGRLDWVRNKLVSEAVQSRA